MNKEPITEEQMKQLEEAVEALEKQAQEAMDQVVELKATIGKLRK